MEAEVEVLEGAREMLSGMSVSGPVVPGARPSRKATGVVSCDIDMEEVKSMILTRILRFDRSELPQSRHLCP